ncbi:MAG: B12-binding domain-containing radical SAM protein [Ruminiclostridium sp.]|nr:B12-binding domain-containing radical SAM protein [Ruminiclostridium sp.]
MDIKKIRFVEPGNRPYRKSLKNSFVYDRYIRTPALGLITLATVAKRSVSDTYMYSEAISKIVWDDVLDADVIFIGIFTFNANRGYELAEYIRKNSSAVIVIGGLHASLNYEEAVKYADYVILGEGDESVPKLIDELKNDRVPDFEGLAYIRDGEIIKTGEPIVPHNIDIIPDRNLCYNYDKMVGHSTIWPQVHASRGCPHNCAYCALVKHYGRKVRTRSPENVVEDIKETIAFHRKKKRLAEILWITDDNFFADRKWAVSVLNAIIESGIKYKFTIQVRYEVGFDDEMLELLKRAGFDELSMGIEFLEDEAFEQYEKKSTYSEILRSVKNIQAHGMRVRGLFIVGADNHTKGVGKRLADFVIEHNICGVLIQSMYFIPGTPVYDTHKDKLIDNDWSRCIGKVVHYPEKISPYDLQKEIIYASSHIYSFKRLLSALFKKRGLERILFIGEFFWQMSVRSDLKKELPWLKEISEKSGLYK